MQVLHLKLAIQYITLIKYKKGQKELPDHFLSPIHSLLHCTRFNCNLQTARTMKTKHTFLIKVAISQVNTCFTCGFGYMTYTMLM